MGSNVGKGIVLLMTKRDTGDFAARSTGFVAIYSAVGVRDAEMNDRLGKAMMAGIGKLAGHHTPSWRCARAFSVEPAARGDVRSCVADADRAQAEAGPQSMVMLSVLPSGSLNQAILAPLGDCQTPSLSWPMPSYRSNLTPAFLRRLTASTMSGTCQPSTV